MWHLYYVLVLNCRLQSGALSSFERLKWIEEARLDAIMGSCLKSKRSVQSGLRTYIAFVGRHAVKIQWGTVW